GEGGGGERSGGGSGGGGGGDRKDRKDSSHRKSGRRKSERKKNGEIRSIRSFFSFRASFVFGSAVRSGGIERGPFAPAAALGSSLRVGRPEGEPPGDTRLGGPGRDVERSPSPGARRETPREGVRVRRGARDAFATREGRAASVRRGTRGESSSNFLRPLVASPLIPPPRPPLAPFSVPLFVPVEMFAPSDPPRRRGRRTSRRALSREGRFGSGEGGGAYRGRAPFRGWSLPLHFVRRRRPREADDDAGPGVRDGRARGGRAGAPGRPLATPGRPTPPPPQPPLPPTAAAPRPAAADADPSRADPSVRSRPGASSTSAGKETKRERRSAGSQTPPIPPPRRPRRAARRFVPKSRSDSPAAADGAGRAGDGTAPTSSPARPAPSAAGRGAAAVGGKGGWGGGGVGRRRRGGSSRTQRSRVRGRVAGKEGSCRLPSANDPIPHDPPRGGRGGEDRESLWGRRAERLARPAGERGRERDFADASLS
ncbi:hypothetical protein ACHAWF_012209, partial [Thalassiosira exigua]